MNGGEDGLRPRGLANDDRARVPFALISIFLLVSSVMVVSYTETRNSPEIETDPELALDRTDAAVQTAIRDGVKRATERAAEQPLTRASETRYGEIIDDGDSFENYLRALIYLEVSERLGSAGQTVGYVETDASLPDIEDNATFEEAIEHVESVQRTVDKEQ